MLLIDGLMLAAFAVFAVYTSFDAGIILSAMIGISAAYVVVMLMRKPYVGRVLQFLVGVQWVWLLHELTEHFTGGGLTAARETYPAVYYPLLTLLTAASIWLQFRFVRDKFGSGIKGAVGAMFTGGDTRKEEKLDEDIVSEELDKYHESFTRISSLIDEITKSKAFRADGDSIFGLISDAMSFIQDHNAETEKIPERFLDADEAEKGRLLSFLYYVNGEMLRNERALKDAFEKLKADFGSDEAAEESSRRRKRSSAGNMPEDPRITMFFNGCDTREKLDKRYKSLAKTYHPDMESGDTETMALINQEYERLKDFFGQ